MPSATIPAETKRRAMLRAQSRVNPCLAADMREDIHNLTVCRRRIERMLSGDLKIQTTATPEKLRHQLGDLDAEILRLCQDLNHLQP
jgi:hypothetical protein